MKHRFPLLSVVFVSLSCPHQLMAETRARVVATLPDTPEGICVDPGGDLYVTLFNTGEVIRLEDDGTQEHVAWVPSKEQSGQGILMGIVSDDQGNLFVAYKAHSKYDSLTDTHHPACNDVTDTTSGVYRIDAETREATAVATRGDGWPFCYPDDLDIDDEGTIYLTDLTYAGIWKITAGGEVSMWSDHPLLNWSAQPTSGYPLGVNVLVLDAAEENIYCATDGDPMVLRIPIREDGSAGEPLIISRGHSPFDGIELDSDGNIYLSEVLRQEIMVISPDGAERMMIATSHDAPLDYNASLVLRNGVLYTANLGFGHPIPQEADRTVVAIAGFPRPGDR